MGRMVGLLRAVNVGGRKLPMAALRALCGKLGWEEVATYIQSGNLVFTASGRPAALEAALEKAISHELGLDVPVIVRTAAQWRKLAAGNPFAAAPPNRVLLFASKRPLTGDAAKRLAERAQAGEEVEAAAGGLWIHFPEGAGRSKLTPASIDKACGSPTTGRNYRTVLELTEMLDA